MRDTLRRLCAAASLLVLAGCQSSLMTRANESVSPVPSGQAQLVIMRPSSFGGAIQSSVYVLDANQKDEKFLGVVSSKTKLACTVAPGDYLFMVVGENADFMEAHLEGGKTYYALVAPRMGVWKARFSLLPIHNNPAAKYNTTSSEFTQWRAATELVEKAPQADQWFQEHKQDLDSKRDDYLEEWNSRTAEDKADLVLHKEDGT